MTSTRIQLALNVDDIAEATAFYTRLFGVAPHKVRDGYANFAVTDPPLKLVLIENPGAARAAQPPRRRGTHTGGVAAALARFEAAGLTTTVAEQDVCCHAVQDKVFVAAPDVPLGGGSSTASPTTTRRTRTGADDVGVRGELRSPGHHRAGTCCA